jgi:hypothetical protein
MSYKMPMLITIPRTSNLDISVLVATIDALDDCARACIADADSDLNEQNLSELVKCIRLCLDCADVCAATVRVTSRQTEYDATLSPSPCWRPARPPVRAAATNASGMPRCMITAGSAPWPAGAASRPAGNSWPP